MEQRDWGRLPSYKRTKVPCFCRCQVSRYRHRCPRAFLKNWFDLLDGKGKSLCVDSTWYNIPIARHWPLNAACMRAVRPLLSTGLTSAPCCNSNCNDSHWSLYAAAWTGVLRKLKKIYLPGKTRIENHRGNHKTYRPLLSTSDTIEDPLFSSSNSVQVS